MPTKLLFSNSDEEAISYYDVTIITSSNFTRCVTSQIAMIIVVDAFFKIRDLYTLCWVLLPNDTASINLSILLLVSCVQLSNIVIWRNSSLTAVTASWSVRIHCWTASSILLQICDKLAAIVSLPIRILSIGLHYHGSCNSLSKVHDIFEVPVVLRLCLLCSYGRSKNSPRVDCNMHGTHV